MSDRDTIPTDTSIIRRHLLQNRRALIDTGNRNRLVNFPIGSSKAKSIEIFDELSDEVFRILYSEGRKMSFDPGRASSAATEDSDILLLPDILSEDVDESRYTDTKLQTKLTPEGLQKRLTGLYRDARTVEQEQGIEILFLALGFLQWFEDPKSQEPRHAPLVLLPVELVRDNVRSAYKLQLREQDLSHNIGLEERLKQDLGISLPPLPEDENWLPSAYFQSVGDTIRSQERWTIRPNQIALGFFSFTKIAMFHDLDPDVWKGDELAKHPLIRGLLNDGFPEEERLFPEGASVDQIIPAADTFHVVDADSSQALVVEAIRRGRDLVVQGPPGTGKSQTIANVVAAAVMDGKKVLFVSEKIAALKVVHDRLRKVGLSPVCLELHSRNANKKAVVEELGRTLATPLPQQTEGELPQRLQVIRDTLNTQSNLLNTVFDDTGTTPFEALGMQVYLSSQGVKPPHFEIEKAAIWSNDEFRKILDSCSDYIESVASEGLAREHPWRGIGNVLIQPSELQRWQAKLSALAERLIEFSRETQKLYSELSLTGPHTFLSAAVVVQVLSALQKRPWPDAQLPRSLRQGGSRQKLLDCFDVVEDFDVEVRRVSAWFNDSVYNIEPRPLRDLIAEKSRSMLGRLSPSYKRALEEYRRVSSNPVPEQPLEMVKRLDCLVAAIEKEPLARSAGTLLQEHLGTAWQEARLNKSTVMEIFDWLATVEKLPPAMASAVFGFQGSVRTVTSSLDIYEKEREELLTLSTNVVSEIQLTWPSQSSAEVQSIPLDELGVKFRTLANSTEKYVGWCKLSRALATMENCGAGRLLEEVESGRILPTQMRDVVCFLRYEGIWNRAIKTRPGLAELEGQQRTKLVEEFRQLDIKRLSLATKQILFKHGQEMPRGSMGQMGIIRGEIGRQRGLMPVRKLMARAGSVLQQIKPVMLMSPLSVAQFLPPGSVTFDLLVMDEASQIKPEDALGAIARCRQLAVVGDKKQLPPTSFFDRMMNDEEIDEDEEDSAAAVLPSAIEMESILTLCEARGLPSRMLRWHYRSRHPSLIVVSNQEFYENNLFLPPSPNYVRGRDGFVARRVSGSYDRGGTRRNEIEAREVVKAIVDHAQRFPSRSLGVVTFSMAQKTLIEDLLENERRQNSKLEKFVTDSVHEPLFVKNLETVQGDERDVIFVSVGYGPRKPQTGLDSMAFGPVSSEGGERRLNVLFTRARYKCETFVSFVSGDIDLTRTTKRGPQVLKRFLQYAESGESDLATPEGGFDSPFEQAVADSLKTMGFEVDSQVGSKGFRIDLAVKDPRQPGRYMCAIECDGASYHSSKSARERDRLRQSILEDLGWQFYRIWSTDWFRNPDRERDRLNKFLVQKSAEALEQGVGQIAVTQDANFDVPPLAPPADPESQPSYSAAAPYVEAEFAVPIEFEPHELAPKRMAEIVLKVVELEGPIHCEEIARRVARLFGKDRTGNRISDAVMKGIRAAAASGQIALTSNFASISNTVVPVRSRAAASQSIRRADMLPPAEIQAAREIILRENGEMDLEEMVSGIGRLLGFERIGPDLKAAIQKAIE